jgi:hypothetical protein
MAEFYYNLWARYNLVAMGKFNPHFALSLINVPAQLNTCRMKKCCSGKLISSMNIKVLDIFNKCESTFFSHFGLEWNRIHYCWGYHWPIVPAPHDDG